MFHFYQLISYTNNNCHLVLSFINIYIILWLNVYECHSSTDKATENKMKKVAAAGETPTSKRRRGNFSSKKNLIDYQPKNIL